MIEFKKPKFTDAEKWRMKIRLLKGAKEHLLNYQPMFGHGICCALTSAWSRIDAEVSGRARDLANDCDEELKKYIGDALGKHAYLGTWIRAHLGWPHNAYLDAGKLRETRVAWIDWMIKCYKEKLKEI